MMDEGQQSNYAGVALEGHQTSMEAHLLVIFDIDIESIFVLRGEVGHVDEVDSRPMEILLLWILKNINQLLESVVDVSMKLLKVILIFLEAIAK